MNQLDLSFIKRVPIAKDGATNLRIKVEAYNILNHTQFNGVNTSARFDANNIQINSQLGQATSARNARIIQIGATLTF